MIFKVGVKGQGRAKDGFKRCINKLKTESFGIGPSN